MSEYIPLQRQFSIFTSGQDYPSDDWEHLFYSNQPSNSLGWGALLEKDKVIILAEAGSGKTEELRAQAKELHDNEESSFFCRIEDLLEADFDPESDWEIGCSRRFAEWKELQSNTKAYFFLDSIDEARLKDRNALRLALKRFVKIIRPSNLNRAKVFVTSRFSEWRAITDFHHFCSVFAIPASEPQENDIVHKLESLNNDQIRQFALENQIVNPKKFLDDIERSDAQLFAGRPQDLLDLISYWKSHDHSLGRYIEIVEHSIQQKLLEKNPERKSETSLSLSEAQLGAEQLAAAVTLTKKSRIQLLNDRVIDDLQIISIDPSIVLPHWQNSKLNELLIRPIFDEAIYGTARFHHRSVREFLAARWLFRLLNGNLSRRNVEELLITESYGKYVAIPSMQPIAAWLACWDEKIRLKLKLIAPEVLIEHGDPSEFTVEFRLQLLDSVIEQYRGQQRTDLNVNPVMMKRLASPDMAEAINTRLRQLSDHHDLSTLFLRMIRHGQITGCVDQAKSIALSNNSNISIRKTAFRTVVAIGGNEQKRQSVIGLLSQGLVGCNILALECEKLFPEFLSVDQLMQLISAFPQEKRSGPPSIHYRLEIMASNGTFGESTIFSLLEGMAGIIRKEPHLARSKVSERYAWLTKVANKFIILLVQSRSQYCLEPAVIRVFYSYIEAVKHGKTSFMLEGEGGPTSDMKNWRAFGYQLFWYAASASQDGSFPPSNWSQVSRKIHYIWHPEDSDWDHLVLELSHRNIDNERSVALTALYEIYHELGKPEKKLEELRSAIANDSKLVSQLGRWIDPPPLTSAQLEEQRQDQALAQEDERLLEEETSIREDWARHIKANAADLLCLGNSKEGTVYEEGAYLYERLTDHQEEPKSLGVSHWQLLSEEFGQEVAINFRSGCIDYWRLYDPRSAPDYRDSYEVPFSLMIGLSGLAMEVSANQSLMEQLSDEEAGRAAIYAMMDFDGFPNWLLNLQSAFPQIVASTVLEEIQYELSKGLDSDYPRILSLISTGYLDTSAMSQPIMTLLESSEEIHQNCVEYALKVVFKHKISADTKERLSVMVKRKLVASSETKIHIFWLYIWVLFDASHGLKALKEWLVSFQSLEARIDAATAFFIEFGSHKTISIEALEPDYQQPTILEDLLEIIYDYIRFEDDVPTRRGSGLYRSGPRERAERARDDLLELFASQVGQQVYIALNRWAIDAGHQPHRDQLLLMAKRRLELDSESSAWAESAISEFNQAAEKTPENQYDLYKIALHRVLDLKDDLEHADDSIANSLQKISEETELRKYLARHFRQVADGKYRVAQEEEMADATRTDIRFLTSNIQPMPVELKIANNNWSFNKLRERMENQLIKQYMQVSQHGIFLLVYRGDKEYWQDNDGNHYDFWELLGSLEEHAKMLTTKYPNVISLKAVGIDLTLRL